VIYTVRWRRGARDQLAAAWLAAADLSALTAAANRVDRQLERDPLACGESRSGIERVMFEGPLVIAFEVYEARLKVVVLDVRAIRARG
jgi:hypothetical protein